MAGYEPSSKGRKGSRQIVLSCTVGSNGQTGKAIEKIRPGSAKRKDYELDDKSTVPALVAVIFPSRGLGCEKSINYIVQILHV